MFWVMSTFSFPAASRRASARWAALSRAEVVVEDLPDHRPGLIGVAEEELDLQCARVIAVPQPACAPKGRDAAFHADARTGKRGEVAGGADQGGGGADRLFDIGDGWAFHQVTTWCREGREGSIPGHMCLPVYRRLRPLVMLNIAMRGTTTPARLGRTPPRPARKRSARKRAPASGAARGRTRRRRYEDPG